MPLDSAGLRVFRSLDVDETEEAVKASSGAVYGWCIFNTSGADQFIKFYDATVAATSVGTTTPVMTIALPTNGVSDQSFPQGIEFANAITVAAVTGVADSDTTGAGTNECIVNVFYK